MINEYANDPLLHLEIDLVSKKINHFDVLRLQTKQMAITLWLATIGAALTFYSTPLAILGVYVPLPFWIFDANYHRYQEGFTARLKAIQSHLRQAAYQDKEVIFPIPDFYGTHTLDIENHRRLTGFARNFLKPLNVAFYASLILAAATIAVVWTSPSTPLCPSASPDLILTRDVKCAKQDSNSIIVEGEKVHKKS